MKANQRKKEIQTLQKRKSLPALELQLKLDKK